MPFGVPDEYRDRYENLKQALMADVDGLEKKWHFKRQDAFHNQSLLLIDLFMVSSTEVLY